MKKNVTIPAISCRHCLANISRELKDLQGVASVEGDVAAKTVTITWQAPLEWQTIREVLAEIGYPPHE